MEKDIKQEDTEIENKSDETSKEEKHDNIEETKDKSDEQDFQSISDTKSTIKPVKYFSFMDRVLALSLIIIIALALIIAFAYKSIDFASNEIVTYNERGNLEYKVNLKKNDFYEEKSLGKDMIYVASLINNVNVDFKYSFDIDQISNVNFAYDVIGKLVISDNEGKNTFFEKNYTLVKKQKKFIRNDNKYNFKTSVNIDYDVYNDIANKFKSDYGIDTKSNLIIYLNVYKQGMSENVRGLNNSSNVNLTIPLSEKAVDIKMDSHEINKTKQIFNYSNYKIKNYIYLILCVILSIILIIALVLLVKLLLKLRNKRSSYEKYVKKLLREYDRLIVETESSPKKENKNIITIRSFNELLDVRDNLGLPIKYYVVTKNQKCIFYIDHHDELYIMTLKKDSFEEK